MNDAIQRLIEKYQQRVQYHSDESAIAYRRGNADDARAHNSLERLCEHFIQDLKNLINQPVEK